MKSASKRIQSTSRWQISDVAQYVITQIPTCSGVESSVDNDGQFELNMLVASVTIGNSVSDVVERRSPAINRAAALRRDLRWVSRHAGRPARTDFVNMGSAQQSKVVQWHWDEPLSRSFHRPNTALVSRLMCNNTERNSQHRILLQKALHRPRIFCRFTLYTSLCRLFNAISCQKYNPTSKFH